MEEDSLSIRIKSLPLPKSVNLLIRDDGNNHYTFFVGEDIDLDILSDRYNRLIQCHGDLSLLARIIRQ